MDALHKTDTFASTEFIFVSSPGESKQGEAIFFYIRLRPVNASVWTLHEECLVLKNLLRAEQLHQFVTTEAIDLDKTKEQKVHESSS